ncbi:hypothetical protein NE237_009206 [Protea cynaroides]|uniref:Amine oxidase domain-containing protein n=1 Tax=Protea cynaroides TaxID=273540 RepID=A0A9Q0KY68_9MAGN|nr:hypothetical protein NE237_009206 [Protea cynaroides]
MAPLFVLLLVHFALVAGDTSSPSSVIIIGAGMSGISAARTLHDAGIHDILILEATDRIGGRVRQIEIGGYPVEKGANWVQGVGGQKINPIWGIAQKIHLRNFFTDVTDYNNFTTMNVFKQNGGVYPRDVVKTAVEIAKRGTEFGFNISESLKDSSEDMSVLTAQRLYRHVPTDALEMVIDFYYYDFEDSEPPRVTSLKNTEPRRFEIDFGEDQYFVADRRGYASVVRYTATQFLSSKNGIITDPRLKLNKVVRAINYSKNAVTVQTEDGSVYHAKAAMVSASLGVLQSNLIEFKPDLPSWKTLAIYEFSMTVFGKIFLKFPYKFWPTGPGTQYFLYAHERRGYYPIWKHFEDEFPGSNILMIIITDDEARRIERQTDAETEAETMEALRKMFGSHIPNPTDIFVARWWSNRFFKGSFSNWPAGVEQYHFDNLQKPVGPIYFTGEHTSEKYSAYVHGAYLAGIDSAEALIKCLKKGSGETP